MTGCVDTPIMAPKRGLERYLAICGRAPLAVLLSVALGIALAAAFRERSDVFFALASMLLAVGAVCRLAWLRRWADQRRVVMRPAFYRTVLVVAPVALIGVVGTLLAVGTRQVARHWSVCLSIGLGAGW